MPGGLPLFPDSATVGGRGGCSRGGFAAGADAGRRSGCRRWRLLAGACSPPTKECARQSREHSAAWAANCRHRPAMPPGGREIRKTIFDSDCRHGPALPSYRPPRRNRPTVPSDRSTCPPAPPVSSAPFGTFRTFAGNAVFRPLRRIGALGWRSYRPDTDRPTKHKKRADLAVCSF